MDGRETVRKLSGQQMERSKRQAGETEERPNNRQRIETVNESGSYKEGSLSAHPSVVETYTGLVFHTCVLS